MIVFDSSSMILLARIDMLELFIANFHTRVLIPEKVRVEVCIKGREETPWIEKLIEEGMINVAKVKESGLVKKLKKDFSIDEGEAEALTLAIQERADLVATDDRNAIRACKVLKIDFITAIAVLIRAYEKGLIVREEALAKLHKLKSIGRYSRIIMENAAEHIGHSEGGG